MKAKLIKKDSPLHDRIKSARGGRRRKIVKKTSTTAAAVAGWVKNRSTTGNAREAFANLFVEDDPTTKK